MKTEHAADQDSEKGYHVAAGTHERLERTEWSKWNGQILPKKEYLLQSRGQNLKGLWHYLGLH